MNILIFTNGNYTSTQLLQKALSRGHYVTLYTSFQRRKEILSHENLLTIYADTLNYSAVEEAMQGQEVVVDAMHRELKDKDDFYITSAANIIKAMKANQVTRFILLSRHGVNSNVKQAPLRYQLWFKLINWFKMAQLTKLMMLENYVRDSSLQWTIIRPVIIIKSRKDNEEPISTYKTYIPISSSMVSANALAGFLFTVAAKGFFIQKIVTISSK